MLPEPLGTAIAVRRGVRVRGGRAWWVWQRADGGVRVLRGPAVQHGDGAQGLGLSLRWQVAAGA